MEPFEMTMQVEADRAGENGLCKLSTLLYFCQEAAGGHCRLLGLDWQSLAKLDLFWALIRTRLEVCRLPAVGQTVYLKTWPMPTTRTAFPRACEGRDEAGNLLFRCTSLWVLVNIQTRAMLLPGKSGVALDGIILGNEVEAPGSLGPIQPEESAKRKVAPADLDRNGHMNNTRYMDWVADYMDALPEKTGTPTGFTCCYLSEALLGQELTLESCKNPDGSLGLQITRPRQNAPEKPERIFAARVEF